MSQHPVILSTRDGVIGGLVSVGDPESHSAAGSLILLHGRGTHRSGSGQMWTEGARRIAGRGVTVLQVDYPGTGDSSSAHHTPDARWLVDAASWFRQCCGNEGPFLVMGSCYGARLATALAAGDERVTGLAIIVPPFRAGPTSRPLQRVAQAIQRRIRQQPMERNLLRALRIASQRIPVWMLDGRDDVNSSPEIAALLRWIDRTSLPIRQDVIDGAMVHGYRTEAVQQEVIERLTGWVDEQVGQR